MNDGEFLTILAVTLTDKGEFDLANRLFAIANKVSKVEQAITLFGPSIKFVLDKMTEQMPAKPAP